MRTQIKKAWHIVFLILAGLMLNVSCTEGDDDEGDAGGNAGTLPGDNNGVIGTGPAKPGTTNNFSIVLKAVWDSKAERIHIISNIPLVEADIQSKGQSVYKVALNAKLSEQFIRLDASFKGEYTLIILDSKGEKNYFTINIE